jgi:hypothetical protein
VLPAVPPPSRWPLSRQNRRAGLPPPPPTVTVGPPALARANQRPLSPVTRLSCQCAAEEATHKRGLVLGLVIARGGTTAPASFGFVAGRPSLSPTAAPALGDWGC